MDRKDDDDMDALLRKDANDTGKRGSNAAVHKSLITRNLKKAYGEVAGEAVPQRFLDLLNQIEESEEKPS